jgi:hypothetical protein
MDTPENYRGLLEATEDERAQMDKTICTLFINCSMTERCGDDEATKKMVDHFYKLPTFRLLNSRIEAAKVPVSPAVQVLCSAMCLNPGAASMWAYTLNQLAHEIGKPVGMGELAEAFPFGFPTEEGLDRLWDAQKHPDSPCSNWIDDPANYVGIKDRLEDIPTEFPFVDLWGQHDKD